MLNSQVYYNMGKLVLIEVEELESIIDKSISKHFNNVESTPVAPENKVLYSIKELSEFLHCSMVTAQKLKNSGTIPFKQYGRKFQINSSDVLASLGKNKQSTRKTK